MRSYPRNSPQAAARIVALSLLADGHLCKAELDVLHRLGAAQRLGLSPSALQDVVRDLCEDLLATSGPGWSGTCSVDAGTLAALMAEIDDGVLRQTVAQLCMAVAGADDHLADGEATVLAATAEQWKLQPPLRQPGAAAA